MHNFNCQPIHRNYKRHIEKLMTDMQLYQLPTQTTVFKQDSNKTNYHSETETLNTTYNINMLKCMRTVTQLRNKHSVPAELKLLPTKCSSMRRNHPY